jgi:hypothetical protein
MLIGSGMVADIDAAELLADFGELSRVEPEAPTKLRERPKFARHLL